MTDRPEKKPRGPGKRWVKGESGNPAGCKTGARPKAMLALDAVGLSRAEDIVKAMAAKALEGDVAAANIVLARCWPPRKGRPTLLSLPAVHTAADTTAALGAVVAAVADGRLTPEEAQSVAAVLEAQRRAVETLELERRIAALESAKGSAT